MKNKSWINVFVCIVLWAPSALALTDYSGRLDFDGIRKAHQAGLINREDYIVSSLASCFNTKKDSLSVKSQPLSSQGRNLTMMFKLAVEYYDTFSDEGQAYVDKIMMRPDESDYIWELWEPFDPFYLPETVTTYTPSATEYPNLAGRFTFHFVLHSTPDYSGTIHRTTLPFVNALVEVFETAYAKEISDMGYPEPPSDENADLGDTGWHINDDFDAGNIDVYIANCGEYDAYGFTVPLNIGTGSSMASYMVVDNDFIGFATPASDAMRVTVAHEFHHCVQFGINAYAQDWIMEASSTWMEKQVYPDINDNLQYLNDNDPYDDEVKGFFANTDIPIDSKDQWYNNWIFLEYMNLKWDDPGIVRLIWNYLGTSNSGISAVSYALGQKGSNLKTGFTDFAMKNYSQTNFYGDAALYDEVTIQNESGQTLDYQNSVSQMIDLGIITVDHLAAVYYKLLPGSDIGSFDNDTLMVQVYGEAGLYVNAGVSVKLIDGSYEEYDLDANSAGSGYAYVPDFNQQRVSEAVLTLVNFSGNASDNGAVFTVEGGLGEAAVIPDDDGTCFIQSVF